MNKKKFKKWVENNEKSLRALFTMFKKDTGDTKTTFTLEKIKKHYETHPDDCLDDVDDIIPWEPVRFISISEFLLMISAE